MELSFSWFKNFSDYEVLTGTSYKGGSDGQKHKIKKIIIHQNFYQADLDFKNDIALIQVSQSLILKLQY